MGFVGLVLVDLYFVWFAISYLMDKETIHKEIDYHINIKANLWTAIIVTMGGSLTLLFDLDNILKTIFIIIGFLTAGVFINGYLKRDEQIKALFNKLMIIFDVLCFSRKISHENVNTNLSKMS